MFGLDLGMSLILFVLFLMASSVRTVLAFFFGPKVLDHLLALAFYPLVIVVGIPYWLWDKYVRHEQVKPFRRLVWPIW